MTKAVLLDLGNVVLGVDFRRVFNFWANAADVPVQQFYDAWQLDEAYKAHEIDDIDFEAYAAALSDQFGVQLPLNAWRAGWNDLWTEPFHSVIELLPQLAEKYPLYGFSNTNATHELYWRDAFQGHLSSFREIYTSSNIGMRKPDAEAYHHVCSEIQCNPEDVLFLDDTLENVTGALAAGLNAHHVPSEQHVSAKLGGLLK